ncbi:MAG: response regulator transcription factor [Kiritimatiellae bacterium]|nr:response regulator transcription factor [Kiritimatiellia bacterium]
MDNIRVLIADDHAIVRTGLAALLDTEPGIEVVGEAADGAAAVKTALKLRPDVVIMDLMMPVMDGVEATGQIHAKLPETKVLLLTTSTVSDDLSKAIENGATGAITKSMDNDILVRTIREVAAGRSAIAKEIAKIISKDPPVPKLTDRQYEILKYVVKGLSNGEIARQFDIAEITVKNHITAIFTKLGASNRQEAVAIALRKQLLKM